MSELKYKVGDKVLIKSLDWYNNNKNKCGEVPCGEFYFVSNMSVFCGKIFTIDVDFEDGTYMMKEDADRFVFTDEMIECKMEEETKPELKFKVGDRIYSKYHKPSNDLEIIEILSMKDGNYAFRIKNHKTNGTYLIWGYEISNYKLMEQETKPKYEDEVNGEYYSTPKYLVKPSGYQFVDENGNVINATKIVLEKKKKEYPKTYEECINILGGAPIIDIITYYYEKQLKTLYKLLICRDAYWKIAGEEIGLGKPWEPDWENNDHESYPAIVACGGKIIKSSIYTHDNPFTFPTEEMRDAFKKNFDPDIENCKEFL